MESAVAVINIRCRFGCNPLWADLMDTERVDGRGVDQGGLGQGGAHAVVRAAARAGTTVGPRVVHAVASILPTERSPPRPPGRRPRASLPPDSRDSRGGVGFRGLEPCSGLAWREPGYVPLQSGLTDRRPGLVEGRRVAPAAPVGGTRGSIRGARAASFWSPATDRSRRVGSAFLPVSALGMGGLFD